MNYYINIIIICIIIYINIIIKILIIISTYSMKDCSILKKILTYFFHIVFMKWKYRHFPYINSNCYIILNLIKVMCVINVVRHRNNDVNISLPQSWSYMTTIDHFFSESSDKKSYVIKKIKFFKRLIWKKSII